MVNLKKLLEELDEIDRNKKEEEICINGLRLIPHGENAVKYYVKAGEYLKQHAELAKRGFINLPVADLGLKIDSKSLGYELK